MKPSKKQPPQHLSEASRQWWSTVSNMYELSPHHEMLLTLAAETFDRASQARDTIDAEGAVVTDRFGAPKRHPAVNIEQQSMIIFARLLRELALSELPEETRPRRVTGARGGRRAA